MSVSIVLIMGVVRYLMLVEETNMVEAIEGVYKGFTKVKASGVIIVLLKQVQNHKDHTHPATSMTGR